MPPRSPRRRAGSSATIRPALVLALVAVVVLAACQPAPYAERSIAVPWGEVGPGSQLVGCERSAERIVLSVSSHLDPACTYTGGLEIGTSHVTLDCRGAHIEDPTGTARRGILISAPNDVALTDVTVRNCVVKGFLNTIRVSRPDFRTLPPGAEYDAAFSDIVIEASNLYRSRGSGIFVDAYVTGVTIRGVEVAGAGSVGIYLEAGSKDNVVEHSWVRRNGYADVAPEGVPFMIGTTPVRYRSTGREGIAVDGSRDNVIRGNVIAANAAGAIFLYKNCGEYVTERPASWWPRRYGATGNLIEGNIINNHDDGVWVGSRQAENQEFMDCSDTPVVTGSLRRIYDDPASDNVVRGNRFHEVTRGVRVEDDRTRVEGNRFTGTDPDATAVLVGSMYRTARGRPVQGTEVVDNEADLGGATMPYRWIHGHIATVESANTANGTPTTLVEGTQPPIDPFLFVVTAWPEGTPPPP